MKSLLTALFPILLLIPALSFSADQKRISASSRITAVTVYTDRAQTTRIATLTLKPGSYLIAFENLPTLIQDDLVRVEGAGSSGATIAGLEIKRSFLEQSGEKRVQELGEEIRALERQARALDAKKAGLTAQKTFLDSIRVAWGERISRELSIGRPAAAELQDASGFIASGVTRAEELGNGLDVEKQDIKDKIDALIRRRNDAAGSLRKESKSVEVMVEMAREGTLTLALSAVISQAGWVPSYDVRLAPDAKTAELTFRAMVRQQTGEEWNNVDLTLSTARPAAGGAPPELYPWHIGFYRPQPTMAAPMYMGSGSTAPMKAVKSSRINLQDEEAPSADTAAVFEIAQISDEQSSISFHIPRPLDIPSDGTQHGSVVAIEQLPVSMEFMAIPKLSPLVFLKTEIVNRAAYPLLAGKVSTFAGNTFTGSSRLKKVAAGEKFDLFFGSDDQVTVKREELKQHKEAGMFGKNHASFRYRIELVNFRKEALTVTLRDQLPLAGDEEIKVSLEEPSLKPDEVKTDGTIVWKLPMKAGEKRELTFGILVEYPKDREITGR
jgi:uncharacterized protein (TIGR02231 family)